MFSRRVLSLAALTCLPMPAHGAETLWKEITVRVYDSTGAGAAERRAALAIAASIVSVASVELIWRTCNEPASSAAASPQRNRPCGKPLADGELALRIVRSRATDDRSREPLPLGEALIDVRAGSGVLATIFIDRVDSMAAQTGDSRDSLLGRAIAHELGHLLMATSAHSAHGLMRPVWTTVRDPTPLEDRLDIQTDGDRRHQGACSPTCYFRGVPAAARLLRACGAEDVPHRVVALVAGVLEERLIRVGRQRIANVHGFTQVSGSSTVIDHSILSGAVGMNRSISFIFGEPFRYVERGSNSIVSTTSVLPSQWPRASPMCEREPVRGLLSRRMIRVSCTIS